MPKSNVPPSSYSVTALTLDTLHGQIGSRQVGEPFLHAVEQDYPPVAAKQLPRAVRAFRRRTRPEPGK